MNKAGSKEHLADWVRRTLASRRRQRRITPRKPIVGSDLIREYNQRYHTALVGASLRAAIHLLRTRSEPIASTPKGYYFAQKPEELSYTMEHLLSRWNAIREVVSGVRKAAVVLAD